jgi:uncharacterized protein YndB with AHSA1/START domain
MHPPVYFPRTREYARRRHDTAKNIAQNDRDRCRTGEAGAVLGQDINKAEKIMTDIANELVLTRLIDAPREKLFRCWTEPSLLKQWFAPAPVTTPIAEVDLRVGGANFIVMQMPDGKEIPCPGTYLEIVPNKKLVFTDAYTGDWVPKTGKPFMTAIITFEDEDGKTRYTARARHWSKEDCDTHVQMGFHQGWGQCADQLAALAKTI